MLRRNIHGDDLALARFRHYRGSMASRAAHSHAPHRHDHAHDQAGEDACCAGHAIPAGETLALAEESCRQRGLRLTPQRRAVLEVLAETKRPLGAYDIIERLRPGGGRGPAPIVIYRALDFLRENGFIHRLESLNAFIACPHRHGSGEKVVFLICEACQHVEEAVAAPLSEALTHLARAHGFAARRQVIELAGTCRHCQPLSTRQDGQT
ncbi:MAG: transcriptional repressor [Beijerinckiaceae bacterium]|nr:transcriptional repressor [Beijerinckiaceae bacterium]